MAEEGSRKLRKMQVFGYWWTCGELTCEARQVSEPTAALGWTLEVGGSCTENEGASSCRAHGQSSTTEDFPPWLTALFL